METNRTLEIIRSEIERRLKNTRDYMNGAGMKYKGPKYHASRGRESAYDAILSFLSTLESEKPTVQELTDAELDKEVDLWYNEYAGNSRFDWIGFARHFAKWGAEHTPLPEDTVLFNKGVAEGKRLMMEEFEGNRLAACDSQTKEEYERETDFVDSIIKKEHRQPTFSDAINYGMRLQKEQMMKGAEPAEIGYFNHRGLSILTEKSIERMPVSEGDKVRVIVLKKED